MPGEPDTVPNLSKDWEFRGARGQRRPGSKVYGWTGGEPRDSLWFVLLLVAVVAVAAIVWLLIVFGYRFLAGA